MNKQKPLLALIMIVLVVEFPILAAAGGIHSYTIGGADGVQHTVRQSDSLNVEVLVSVDNDQTITPDQVWLGSSQPFTSCSPGTGGYTCTLKNSQRIFNPETNFVINLHNDSHSTPPKSFTLVDRVEGKIVVDSKPPRININLDKKKSAGTIKVSFTAYDDSYLPNKFDQCAGIEEITFKSGDLDVGFSYNQNTCSTIESFDIDTTEFDEGEHTVDVVIKDYLDQTTTESFTFIADRTGASFSNLQILDENGEKITHVGREIISALVSVDVSSDVLSESIFADLSSLNNNGNFLNVPGNCASDDLGTVCQWNVDIIPTAYGTQTITFKGQDDIGNVNEHTTSVTIERDLVGPKVVSVSSQVAVPEVVYLARENNTITVVFDESGVGMAPESTFLDLSALGAGRNVPATSCDGDVCTWEDVDVSFPDGKYQITVKRETTDKLGNALDEEFSQEVIVDSTQAQSETIEIINVGQGQVSFEGAATFGDTLQVTLRVFEPGGVEEAFGDFSPFVSGTERIAADDCEVFADGFLECTWIVQSIDKEQFVQDKIVLTIIDNLGNEATYEREFTVYSIEETFRDFWQHLPVKCSPERLDREVTSIISQKVFCHVDLQGNAETVSVELGTCTGGETAEFVREFELVNDQQGTTDPYIKLTLDELEIEQEKIEVHCPIVIFSKTATSVTSVPEIENVTISVPLYNLPLGTYGESLEAKVDDAIESATGGIFEAVETLNKLFFYAERICSLLTTINNIGTLFNTIANFKDIVAKSLSSNPVTAAKGQAVDQARQVDNTVTSQLNTQMKEAWKGGKGFLKSDGINKFCKFISCNLFFDEIEWFEGTLLEDVGGWQRGVLETANGVATGTDFFGTSLGGESLGLGGRGINAYSFEGASPKPGVGRQVPIQGGRLNPKDSLVISALTLCIPGITHNLEKFRQIECMYADCLITSLETGVPQHSCEDLKDYQTCKYVAGEIFQLLPFTGLFSYFMDLVKGVLYNPLGVVDLRLGYVCQAQIGTPLAGKVASLCLLKEVAGLMADVWSDIANIKDDWKIQNDYCDGLENYKSGGDPLAAQN